MLEFGFLKTKYQFYIENQLEEELICETCNGSGFIIDKTGRKDICETCFGLGIVKGVFKPAPLTKSKLKIKRALIGTFLFLAIFYGVFSYSYLNYTFSLPLAIIVLLVGHFVAVSFLVLYLIFRSIKDD